MPSTAPGIWPGWAVPQEPVGTEPRATAPSKKGPEHGTGHAGESPGLAVWGMPLGLEMSWGVWVKLLNSVKDHKCGSDLSSILWVTRAALRWAVLQPGTKPKHKAWPKPSSPALWFDSTCLSPAVQTGTATARALSETSACHCTSTAHRVPPNCHNSLWLNSSTESRGRVDVKNLFIYNKVWPEADL